MMRLFSISCLFLMAFGFALPVAGASDEDIASGVLVFRPNTSLKDVVRIGKELAEEDGNFVQLTAQGWAMSKSEGSAKTSALVFLYKKKNKNFILPSKLGKSLMAKVESKGLDLASYHVSGNVVTLK